MLYSIIPPIAVVISLIGIIVFLAKKAPQIAKIENRNDLNGADNAGEKRGFFGRIFGSKNGEKRDLKHGFLVFLEKTTRKSRMFFLKLENLFTKWSENIRRKRKDHLEAGAENGESGELGEREILNRIENYNYDERGRFEGENIRASRGEDRIVRPFISEKVANPTPKPEIKSRLERILIDRIAANPKDTEAYERLGEYYFEIGNYEHSKECFKHVIKLNPSNMSVKDRMRKLERLLARR